MLVLSSLVLISLQVLLVHSKSILPEAIKHAIGNSFHKTANVLHVVIETEFEENTEAFLDAIDEILVENWTFRIQIDVNNKDGQAVSEHNLWLIDTYEAFRRLLPWIRGYHMDSQLFYFIVLKNSQINEHLNVIQNIFSDLLVLMIGNVHVIKESAAEEILFYTFYPYQDAECLSAKPFLAHRFINSSTEPTKYFFPPKADNFRGCPLRVRTRNELVLTLGRYKLPNELVNYDMSRLELAIVKELAYRMNLTLDIYNATHLAPVLQNETVDRTTEPHKLMSNFKTDAMLGFYKYGILENQLLSKSVPYCLSWMIICLRPKPDRLRSFDWLFFPFNTTTWIYLIASFTLISGCIFLSRKSQRINGIFHFPYHHIGGLEIVSVALGGPVEHMSPKHSTRLLFIVLSLGTLILRAAYQGKLFDALRGGAAIKTPHSIRELFDENYTVYAHPYYRPIINDLNGKEYLNFHNLGAVLKDDNILRIDKNIALVTSDVFVRTFYSAQQLNSLMLHVLLGEQICIYFQQHSIIQPKANEIIMKMEEAGILHHLRRNYENMNDGEMSMDENGHEPRPLVLEQFAFIFYLWGVLCVISCFVFATELLYHRVKK